MKVGFLGFGEAAYELSNGLRKEGLKHIKAYDVMISHKTAGALIKKRAEEADVQLVASVRELITDMDVLFVAVPASKALEVSLNIRSELKGESFLYVDVSASNPSIKQEIEKKLEKVNIPFVDAAMLGPLPVYKHKVPISASGNGIQEFIDKMTPYHMNISAVGSKAGDASAIKLIRSIFMKGIVGLYLETLQASETYNVSQEVLSSLAETMDSHNFMDTLNRLVTSSAIHAERRAYELQNSVDMLKEVGINSDLTKAAKEKLVELSEMAAVHLQGEKPANWKDVLNYYRA
ncbi:3-hydroxyisobutyrate dehydrogenase [Niallia circulans]|jgi:3-hydroxyisobutyrate dehydrogenase-like beta-hydroxyacid dehydrogenase|uniref:NAD(P)-dependent oxidoreductase n=1 Tax=Shouchella TaxID=2893057 RepID=UPI000BA51C3F|nr:DUF1932 domain-containing protein [Shouchella clausii]SPU17711.1 3-hydroxyisobutyrate dehydrogenase [Niallia circulans]MBU8598829.1 DUF1932 domain-containing protein [Shouchella clausii]MCM3548372.1 DUF1932 domain-containing protein [Shouchella clausii]MCY1107082.1 DUF1932 domain-containing protein [Shouchella clausii]MEB5478037.1 DUF1932 domain-containing protein [Shouchella clausii]